MPGRPNEAGSGGKTWERWVWARTLGGRGMMTCSGAPDFLRGPMLAFLELLISSMYWTTEGKS